MKRWALVCRVVMLAPVWLLASCGQPGSPQPPSLELPRAVEDLSATRRGDRVTLRWTPPTRFTDGHGIRQLGPTHICRAEGTAPAATCNVVGTLAAPPPAPKHKALSREPMEYVDVLPPSLQASPTKSVMYGVEVLNVHGRSVGVSTQMAISTAPSLAPPSQLAANVADDGITLSWAPVSAPSETGIAFAVQIERKGEQGDFAPVATVPIGQSSYLDQTFEWEKKYDYRVVTVTESADGKQVMVEGLDSAPITVFAHDVFPPAQPREVQAVFSGPGQQAFIDLSWAPNLEPDLAGYNVYRREEGSDPIKLNSQLVTAPSFRDEHVEPGKQYFYSIEAVDLRGNQSPKSAEASETVPR